MQPNFNGLWNNGYVANANGYCCPAATPTSNPTLFEECLSPVDNFNQDACPIGFSADSTGYYCCQDSSGRNFEVCDEGYHWDFEAGCCLPGPSPIFIDIAGDGFDLTNAENGVNFDLNSDGAQLGR